MTNRWRLTWHRSRNIVMKMTSRMSTICKAQIHMVSIVHVGHHPGKHVDPLISRETWYYEIWVAYMNTICEVQLYMTLLAYTGYYYGRYLWGTGVNDTISTYRISTWTVFMKYRCTWHYQYNWVQVLMTLIIHMGCYYMKLWNAGVHDTTSTIGYKCSWH